MVIGRGYGTLRMTKVRGEKEREKIQSEVTQPSSLLLKLSHDTLLVETLRTLTVLLHRK